MGYKYIYVPRKMLRYLCVSSPVGFPVSAQSGGFGTIAADLRVRLHLTPGA